jgi:hypothetical protein
VDEATDHQNLYGVDFSRDGTLGIAVGEVVDRPARRTPDGRTSSPSKSVILAWRRGASAPSTAARSLTINRGSYARVAYRVSDKSSATSAVVVRVFKGKMALPTNLVAKSNVLRSRRTNRWHVWRFWCVLPTGRYTVRVDAVNSAGVHALRKTLATLTVR